VENLFAHDPFREGKVEETLFDAASALLKYVLVNGHAVPASAMEVNAEEGCVRVAYEGEIIESAKCCRVAARTCCSRSSPVSPSHLQVAIPEVASGTASHKPPSTTRATRASSAAVFGKATSSSSGPGGVTRAATRKTSSARRTVPCSHPPFMFTTNTMASGQTNAMETQISPRNSLSNSSTL
jgi:hypothetical protein